MASLPAVIATVGYFMGTWSSAFDAVWNSIAAAVWLLGVATILLIDRPVHTRMAE
ncbi:MAG: hypothetical protein FWC87_02220 [Acidimicrobiaceae bacterium]|nr:hypothetical protein [Acidimicrobiaceae bacterium]